MPAGVILEYRFLLLIRYAAAVVLHKDLEVALSLAVGNDDVSDRRAVADGILHQVGHHIAEERVGIYLEAFCPEPYRDIVPGPSDVCLAERLLDPDPFRG